MAQAEDLNAVRRRSKAASNELAEEQHESVMSLAHALDTISANESVAHIESRLSFLERQVERLLERREEVEQTISSDLSLMRARVDDALEAIADSNNANDSLSSVLEERLAEAVDLAERKIMRTVQHSRPSGVAAAGEAGPQQAFHAEIGRLSVKVDELIARVSSAEARWSAQKNHFDTLVSGLTARVDALQAAEGADSA